MRISDWSSDVCSSDLELKTSYSAFPCAVGRVREFMGDQMIALRGPRGERPAVESDVVAKRVGPGADRVCGAGRGGVAVDADVAKVLPECRLHSCANCPGAVQKNAVQGKRVTVRVVLDGLQ